MALYNVKGLEQDLLACRDCLRDEKKKLARAILLRWIKRIEDILKTL